MPCRGIPMNPFPFSIYKPTSKNPYCLSSFTMIRCICPVTRSSTNSSTKSPSRSNNLNPDAQQLQIHTISTICHPHQPPLRILSWYIWRSLFLNEYTWILDTRPLVLHSEKQRRLWAVSARLQNNSFLLQPILPKPGPMNYYCPPPMRRPYALYEFDSAFHIIRSETLKREERNIRKFNAFPKINSNQICREQIQWRSFTLFIAPHPGFGPWAYPLISHNTIHKFNNPHKSSKRPLTKHA